MTNDLITVLDTVLSKPIAFHRIFATIAGGATEGLFLSQAYYWSKRTKDSSGWFYKTGEEWEEETALARREQEVARKKLKALGVLEEKKEGVPCKLYFRLKRDRLFELILGKETGVLSVDKLIEIYDSTLVGLSKTSVMRATQLGVDKEYVDYREVVRKNGLICHICGEAILKGIGQSGHHLSFDHVVPLSKGGKHVFDNVKPSHAGCNLLKSDSLLTLSKQGCLGTTDLFADGKQTSLPTLSKQVCLETANNLYTENTSEITSEREESAIAQNQNPSLSLGTDCKTETLTSLLNKPETLQPDEITPHEGKNSEAAAFEKIEQTNYDRHPIARMEEKLRSPSLPWMISNGPNGWNPEFIESHRKHLSKTPHYCENLKREATTGEAKNSLVRMSKTAEGKTEIQNHWDSFQELKQRQSTPHPQPEIDTTPRQQEEFTPPSQEERDRVRKQLEAKLAASKTRRK